MNTECYKVSVLVAAYNAEKFIRKCIDSLLVQTLREVEVICIDDASTDQTLSVLKEYAAADTRVIVLSQPFNQGQAKARNLGLSVATGEFITFLDSDDWLSEDALELAYRVTQENPQTDAVIFDMLYYYEQDGTYAPYHYKAEKKTYTGKEAMKLSLDWRIHGIYLIRASIHQSYPYDTSCRMYSDDNTTHIHMLHSREVRFCQGIYYYRQHPVSNTHHCDIRRFDYIDAGLILKQTLEQEGMEREIIARQENHRWKNMVGMYIYYLENKKYFTSRQREEIIDKFEYHLGLLDTTLLSFCLKYKFGYIPFKGHLKLFRAEIWLYHHLRRLLGRG